MSNSWMLATILGPVVLIAAFLYVFMTRRRLSRDEKAAQHQQVERLYNEGDRDV